MRGALALVLAGFALVWPKIALTDLVLLFGSYALLDGVLAIVTGARFGAREQAWLHWLEGFVGVGAGLAIFFWSGLGSVLLVDLIGAWAALTGILELMMAIRLRRVLPGEWLLGFAGTASIILGVLMLLWPMTGAFVIVVLLGCYALFFGAAILLLSMRLRRMLARPDAWGPEHGHRQGATS